ncbi:DUF721 domain-containing protein [Thalassotalea sp. LPB0316]|uniref:DUF721 domain-containing protein n=1 Tax=Thalassotalea sp. LPB0316 TaxID=2769490 RepID=UPI001D0548F7|nr:DciA family protein [Thalassotalea sp. LPB0316]
MAHIATKTNSLASLSDTVKEICPDIPDDAWHLGNIKGDTIVIEVKSSVWSQRFQFERFSLAQAFNQQTNGAISRIDISVMPFLNKAEIKQPVLDKPKKQMSVQSASELIEVAKNAPEGLRQKLEKLASHANKTK